MDIIEFQKIDSAFNESMFMTKVNNIFVKLLTSIMLEKIKDVEHFLGDEVSEWASLKVQDLQKQGYRQMYEEMNVRDSHIADIEVLESCYKIRVKIEARYIDYIMNKSDNTVVSGQNNFRIQQNYLLTFSKNKNTIDQGIAKKCSSCGASINVNSSGICEYCGNIYKQEKYDWVLTKLELI